MGTHEHKLTLRGEEFVMEPEREADGSVGPEASSPRMFGGPIGSANLPWAWATERLSRAHNYWIATTRPAGQPHSRPVWGVWLDTAFYFSTGSLAAQNLAVQPAITVHLESGSEVVIIEGAGFTCFQVLTNICLATKTAVLCLPQNMHQKLSQVTMAYSFRQ